MTFDEYRQLAIKTINIKLTHSERIDMVALGLIGESGEFANIVKKHRWHEHPLDKDKLAKEVGDLVWYCAGVSDTLGIPLPRESVAEFERNVLKGAKTEYEQGPVLSWLAWKLDDACGRAAGQLLHIVHSPQVSDLFSNVGPPRLLAIEHEIRRILRYCVAVAYVLKCPFVEILRQNIEKLQCRYGDKFSVEASLNHNG